MYNTTEINVGSPNNITASLSPGLRIEDGAVCWNTFCFHTVYDLPGHYWIGDDEHCLSVTLQHEFISERNHFRASKCSSIPYNGVGIGLQNCILDVGSISRFRIRARPKDAAGGGIGIKEG